jgi:internalin A
MSDSPSRLPERPSLEQLRKQAKDRLKTLRAEGGDATLADVQFSLAREYGFQNWAALVHHVETVNPPGLRKYERMAEELAAAYASGDFEAIREFNWTYGTSFVWHRDLEAMHRCLPTWFASEPRSMDLAVADARVLIARKHGYDTWEQLIRGDAPTGGSAAPGSVPDLPFCRIDPELGMAVDGSAADAHWERIIAVIVEQGITGLLVNGLTDRGMKELSGVPTITRLGIGGAQLTDSGMQHLARMPQLEELGLGGPKCRVTDRGLEALRHLRELRKLTMTWAPMISDDGIAHLAGCERLEHVDLMGTPTGDGALAALADKPRLRHLATGRVVTDRGTALLQRFPVFKAPFTGEVKYDLMSFSASPNSLLLDGPFSDKGLAHLAGLEGLVSVNLFWHTPGFTPQGLKALTDVPNLAFLECDGKRCDDDAMRHIAAIPRLRMLMAQGTIATDAGFEALSRSTTIEYIWGRECPTLTGRGFAALSTMPALRGLAVSCALVDDEGLATLPRFPSLTGLMPMDVHDAGFRFVGGCERLEDLWCMYCRDTTDAATEHLTGLSKLKSYYAGMTKITDRSLEILGGLTTLERLEFWEVAGITDAGLKALATLPRLREVSIGGSSQVTRAGVAQFPPHVRVKHEP